MACLAEQDRGSSAATSPSSNALIRKLSHFAPLSESDRQVLDSLAAPDEYFRANVDIIEEDVVLHGPEFEADLCECQYAVFARESVVMYLQRP